MANNTTEGIKIVTTRENNYFLNNKIVFVEDEPSEGQFITGDIAINMYPSDYFGWICIEDGEPGIWQILRSVTDELMLPWSKIYQKPKTFTPTIGETSDTAFRGDYGQVAFEHSQSNHAPSDAQKNSDITKAEIEAKLTGVITSHTHNYAGSSSAGGSATSAEKVNNAINIVLGQVQGGTRYSFDGSNSTTVVLNPTTLKAASVDHTHSEYALTDHTHSNYALTTHTHSEYASSSHSHGLLESDLTVEVENTNVNGGWSMLCNGNSYTGFLLKSIRTGASAPNWLLGSYSSGIAFGGSDTKGVMSVSYQSPGIRFAGGNGTAPSWYMQITGTSEKFYNLDDFATTSDLGDINTILSDIVGS